MNAGRLSIAAACDRLGGDLTLQDRLGAIASPEEFWVAARDLGLAVDRDEMLDTLRHRPVAGPPEPHWPQGQWLPSRSVPGADGPAFHWAWFGREPLTHGFFEESARRAESRPLSRLLARWTPLATLVGDMADEPHLTPDGLIFHMSRCGSTLAARMLMAVAGTHVVSEAEPIDAVVAWSRTPGVTEDEAVAALRAIVAALGRERGGGARRYILKLDAWHMLALPLFRAAFPDVPWLFIHRDPVEVLMSHESSPGLHTVPGMLGGLFDGDYAAATSLADYHARVLAKVCHAAVAGSGTRLFVGYPALIEEMGGAIPRHFALSLTEADRTAMRTLTQGDAKHAGTAFVADSARKQQAASPAVHDAAALHLAPIHEELERLSALGVMRR